MYFDSLQKQEYDHQTVKVINDINWLEKSSLKQLTRLETLTSDICQHNHHIS